MAEAGDLTTEDAFLGGRLVLRQLRRGHRAGHDAILLAAATDAAAGERVVEFGAGVGAAGLALAARVGAIDLALVEIDQDLAALARDNAARNGIGARVHVLDVTASSDAFVAADLPPDSVDVVLMNPPFNAAGLHQASPDQQRRVAHVGDADLLDVWVHAARRVLRPGGRLSLIWRAEALDDALAALRRGFGRVIVWPVHSRSDRPAIRVLIRATKGARAPLRVQPGLPLMRDDGSQTAVAELILRNGQAVPFAE